jgi:hypothetical protein
MEYEDNLLYYNAVTYINLSFYECRLLATSVCIDGVWIMYHILFSWKNHKRKNKSMNEFKAKYMFVPGDLVYFLFTPQFAYEPFISTPI